jgi:hypothetical protein
VWHLPALAGTTPGRSHRSLKARGIQPQDFTGSAFLHSTAGSASTPLLRAWGWKSSPHTPTGYHETDHGDADETCGEEPIVVVRSKQITTSLWQVWNAKYRKKPGRDSPEIKNETHDILAAHADTSSSADVHVLGHSNGMRISARLGCRFRATEIRRPSDPPPACAKAECGRLKA